MPLWSTCSEFGRTVSENGNRGTDHGQGTAMLVLGGNARASRVYGRWPRLGAGRTLRGARSRGHDRLPDVVGRGGPTPPRRLRVDAAFSAFVSARDPARSVRLERLAGRDGAS